MSAPQLVMVTWDDAYGEDDGESFDDAATYDVRTVGWLIDEGVRHIRIAAELLPDGRARGVTRIPRSIVLSVKRLRS